MGDIIAGIFLVLLSVILFGIYNFITRKKKHARSLQGFITLLLFVGGSLGILVTLLQQHQIQMHSDSYVFTLLFFIIQTVTAFLHLRSYRPAFVLLLITLLLQIPILYNSEFYYRSQTLLGLNIGDVPIVKLDAEPGSYAVLYLKPAQNPEDTRYGLNLIPLIFLLLFFPVKRKITNAENTLNRPIT